MASQSILGCYASIADDHDFDVHVFGALGVMPAAVAGAGLFTSPIWVLILTIVVFRAPVGIWRILSVAVGFGGVVLILNPGESAFDLVTFMPALAGAFYATGAVMTRRLCADETTTAMLMNMFVTLGVFGMCGVVVMSLTVNGSSFFTMGWQPMSEKFLWLTLGPLPMEPVKQQRWDFGRFMLTL